MENPNNIASVSVVIPCYRCVDTIERAVKSVAEQTLKPYEVILVEDCSSDNTLETLYKLQSKYGDNWIKVIPLDQNSGPGTARNIGWNASAQDYIAFLDADDSWHPNKIEIQYVWMAGNPEVDLTGHDFLVVNAQELSAKQSILLVEESVFVLVSVNQLLMSNKFPTSSVMLKRNIIQRFPPSKRYCEDYHLWLDICSAGLQCYRTALPMTFYYKAPYGESGLSGSLWKMEKGELDVYFNLLRNKNIGRLKFLIVSCWSISKFLRRLLVR